ncbi:hypothetical protein ACQ4PT_005358 [Festuca glaucescens]
MAPPSAAAAAGGLVLWLHGSGETGELSRAQVAPYFSAAPALRLCFPTAPITPIAWNGDEIMINAWFGIPEAPITATTVRDEKGVLKAVEDVHEMLDREVAAGTSPANIFVCGLSQGGCSSRSKCSAVPQNFRRLCCFQWFSSSKEIIRERVPPEARKTPVLWFHGMADGLVLFEAGRAGCAFLRKLGMACVFKAYPGLGHSLVDQELQYFRQWVLERLGISQQTEAAGPSSSS